MAQRNSAPAGKPGAGKPTSNKPGTTKPAGAASRSGSNADRGNRPASGRPAAGRTSTAVGSRPPARKPGKSIVNQKQRPWGLIIATVAVVAFAVAIVAVVIGTRKGPKTTTTAGGQAVNASDPYRHAALPAAMAIKGVTYRVEAQHDHVSGAIKYDSSPPVGGDHNAFWADCTGTVYPNAIANENAVHVLEHGAIWVTYNPKTLNAAGVARLKTYVTGVDHTAMSPYPNLKTPISLQAWGYQLFLSSPSDPRIAQFIATLKENPKTTPEQGGLCSQPTFKTSPSTFGHPKDA